MDAELSDCLNRTSASAVEVPCLSAFRAQAAGTSHGKDSPRDPPHHQTGWHNQAKGSPDTTRKVAEIPVTGSQKEPFEAFDKEPSEAVDASCAACYGPTKGPSEHNEERTYCAAHAKTS